MKLAILFWFYKNPEVCANRLELLRKFNPDATIYGLYGGDKAHEGEFRAALQDDLDDFYAFPEGQSAQWKWRNGDLMIAEWYRTRGRSLSWDTVVLAQWDMIVAGEIGTLFCNLQKDEILLSGLRPVREVEGFWFHVRKRNPKYRAEYFAFLERARNEYGYDDDPLACLFIVVCLPRAFLEQYSKLDDAELGHLEYKIPIYAQVFGIPFCTAHRFHPWWDRPIFRWHPRRRWNPFPPRWTIPSAERALNAVKWDIPVDEMRRQLKSPDGARIFHPVSVVVTIDDIL